MTTTGKRRCGKKLFGLKMVQKCSEMSVSAMKKHKDKNVRIVTQHPVGSYLMVHTKHSQAQRKKRLHLRFIQADTLCYSTKWYQKTTFWLDYIQNNSSIITLTFCTANDLYFNITTYSIPVIVHVCAHVYLIVRLSTHNSWVSARTESGIIFQHKKQWLIEEEWLSICTVCVVHSKRGFLPKMRHRPFKYLTYACVFTEWCNLSRTNSESDVSYSVLNRNPSLSV